MEGRIRASELHRKHRSMRRSWAARSTSAHDRARAGSASAANPQGEISLPRCHHIAAFSRHHDTREHKKRQTGKVLMCMRGQARSLRCTGEVDRLTMCSGRSVRDIPDIGQYWPMVEPRYTVRSTVSSPCVCLKPIHFLLPAVDVGCIPFTQSRAVRGDAPMARNTSATKSSSCASKSASSGFRSA
jgi:hypothetical protein